MGRGMAWFLFGAGLALCTLMNKDLLSLSLEEVHTNSQFREFSC